MSTAKYMIGPGYGANSVGAVIVNAAKGLPVPTGIWHYAHGTRGIILSS